MVDQMQLVRFDDPEYLTCKLTLECADLGNDAAFRQPFQKGGSVRDDRTVPEVVISELGRELYQALSQNDSGSFDSSS